MYTLNSLVHLNMLCFVRGPFPLMPYDCRSQTPCRLDTGRRKDKRRGSQQLRDRRGKHKGGRVSGAVKNARATCGQGDGVLETPAVKLQAPLYAGEYTKAELITTK